MNDDRDLDTARGAYVGEVGREEALAAIEGHSSGPTIVEYPENGLAGGPVVRAMGWASRLGEETDIFAFTEFQEVPLVTGVGYRDAFVLDLTQEGWVAERYTGGLDLHFAQDLAVRLVFWREVSHRTPSGDVAPGFGTLHTRGDDAETAG